jgi:hypothetical protein
MGEKTRKYSIFDVFLQFCLVVSTKMPTFAPELLTIKKDYCLSKQTLLNTIKIKIVYEYFRKYDRRRVGIILHQWQ